MPKSSKAAVAPATEAAPARGKAAPKGSAASRSGGRATPSGRSSATSAKARSKAAPGKSSAKGAKGAPPSPDRFFEEQRALLVAEREASLRQAEALRAEAAQLAEEMEPGDTQFDEESGEGGTLNVERERDLALSAQALSAVEEIDRALAKLDAGTYGTCEGCGQPIPKARLKALPYATLCVGCKSGGLSRR
jgi:DnaK suppressor protein